MSSLRRALRVVLSLLAATGLMLAVGEELIPELHDGDAVATASVSQSGPRDLPGAPHSPTSAHICHCLHAHALAPVANQDVVVSDYTARTARTPDVRLPRSAFGDPPLRPPIG